MFVVKLPGPQEVGGYDLALAHSVIFRQAQPDTVCIGHHFRSRLIVSDDSGLYPDEAGATPDETTTLAQMPAADDHGSRIGIRPGRVSLHHFHAIANRPGITPQT